MKIKNIIIGIISVVTVPQIDAQNDISAVLKSVEENNTTLKALRKATDAQKLGNRTDIYLEGPEFEGGYMWGKPSDLGNRINLSATQRFDFSTITGMKNRYANHQNKSTEWQYEADRKEILLEAKLTCIDAIYYNILQKEHKRRAENAAQLASIYERRLATGDANRLEYNNVKLSKATYDGQKQITDTELNASLAYLRQMNGGVPISITSTDYPSFILPQSFDELHAIAAEASPELAYYKQEEEVGREMLKINRTDNLPALTAGYISEKVGPEHFQGISVGVSIPLWSNKNKVAQSKAAVAAAQAQSADAQTVYQNRLEVLYNKAKSLSQILNQYRETLENASNMELLQKALNAGEISIYNYFIEISAYYELIDNINETEMNYQKTVAELTSYML